MQKPPYEGARPVDTATDPDGLYTYSGGQLWLIRTGPERQAVLERHIAAIKQGRHLSAREEGVLRSRDAAACRELEKDWAIADQWNITVNELWTYRIEWQQLREQYQKLIEDAGHVFGVARRVPPRDLSPKEQVEELREQLAELQSWVASEQGREYANLAHKIKRWQREGLSRSEMARRLGGRRADALKTIRILLDKCESDLGQ